MRVCICVCDQVVCGRRPCLPQSSSSQSQPSCPAGHECLKHNFFTCFSPPCHQWGVCSTSGASLPQVTTKCQPNSGHLDNSCVRMTLVFNRDKVPVVSHVLLGDDVRGFVVLDMNLMSDVLHVQGTTVENVCFELTYLPGIRGLAQDHALLLLCDRSHSNQDSVEVAIVSEKDSLEGAV